MSNPMLYGVTYSPTWTTWSPPYSNSGPDAQFSDADFCNDAFAALWNTGTTDEAEKQHKHAFRDDLKTMTEGGFTLLRLYDWGPTRGWQSPNGPGTAHINFLNYALSKKIKVIVPVSNYFLSDDTYAWNQKDPHASYSLTSAPPDVQTALAQFIASVTDPTTGNIHAAVHSFSVGNEIDINDFTGQGSSGAVGPSSRLARAIWWMINLQQATANLGGGVLMTSPISNADQGNPGTNPMSYWFGAFVNGVTGGTTNLPQGTTAPSDQTTFGASWNGLSSISGYADWYYNSVNIYQYGSGLTATIGQYDNWTSQSSNSLNWPGQQFTVPLLLTEIGVTRGSNDASGQQAQAHEILHGIVLPIKHYVSKNASSYLMGYCLYEFSDEAYLNANWGLLMVEPTQHPNGHVLFRAVTGATQVSYGTFPSVHYPVDQLFPVTMTDGKTLLAHLKAAQSS